ncbi:MAG: FISUMP domain-containing protein [Bacteroidales bacterium]
MKKHIFTLLITVFSIGAFAQVGINTDNSDPDPSAMLDVKSSDKGFLPPRLTLSEIESIPNPAEGLIVYNTETRSLYVFNGSIWTDINGNTYQPAIGDFFEGGIVFYIDSNGSGLVCALTNQSAEAEWGCFDTYFGTSSAIGTGAQNTNQIVAGCTTPGIAAAICANLTLNGYDDWFLPSKDELNEMYQNKSLIDANATENGGSAFGSDLYWSSSDVWSNAWTQNFGNGNQSTTLKSTLQRVRAVRAFSCPSTTPAVPAAIFGNTTVAFNALEETYIIAEVLHALSYQWTVPTGANIISGQGTTSIKVNYGTASGDVSVRAIGLCGNSNYKTLGVNVEINCGSSFVDARDGKTYNTVAIGPKCWMKENLNYDQSAYGYDDCYGYNSANCEIYGRLYDWDAIMQGASSSNTNPSGVQGVCPAGWHIPSDSEWDVLAGFLGGPTIAGGKMKETDTIHWLPPNTGATNSSGFTGLPGGMYSVPNFYNLSEHGWFWSCTNDSNSSYAWAKRLIFDSEGLASSSQYTGKRLSVRCVVLDD